MTPICSSCGLPITSAVFPEPHPPECGPPARLCVGCRRNAVDRWARVEVQALWRLREAAPALLEACKAWLWHFPDLDEILEGHTADKARRMLEQTRAAVALALPEEKTDARD